MLDRGVAIEVFYVNGHQSTVQGEYDYFLKNFVSFKVGGWRAHISFVDNVVTAYINLGAMDVVLVHLDFADNVSISDIFTLIFMYFFELEKVEDICAFNLAVSLIKAPELVAEICPPNVCVCRFFH